MNFRLRTSKETAATLKQLQASTNLTPNILSRIAVALSLKNPEPVPLQKLDSEGLEFNRNTLTGEYDEIFKALIAQHCKRELSDEEYFPTYFNAHLERGIRLLLNEYKYAGNYEKLLRSLLLQS